MEDAKDFAYDSWCRNAGVEPLTPYERALGNQRHLERFIRIMREHTVQGFFRYGSMASYRDNPDDFLAHIMERVFQFEKDGNIEHFVDIANWAAIGFVYTGHPLKHYQPHNKQRD